MSVYETDSVTLMDSILMSVRSACGVSEEDDGFDNQLIPLINSYLMMGNHELGIGRNGFVITGPRETWTDWLGEAKDKLASAVTWVGIRVLLAFDPPENSSVLKAYQETVNEMGWMLRSKSELEGHSTTLYPVEYVEED